MKEEIKVSLDKFSGALERLKEGAKSAKDDLEKDGVIQRFEFTVELLWKTLKIILGHEGIICNTPRECLKSAFRIGLIKDDEEFLNMLEDRNRTSHIYSKEESEEIFYRIKENYLQILDDVYLVLSNK
jgi:nucleotidyltransferase substrate binding protein (TIGR01987 family)